MKGMPGVMIAVGLGVAAAVINWLYMSLAATDMKMVEFVTVTGEVKEGERFRPENLVPVGIPGDQVGNLDKLAVKWSEINTVPGALARRSFRGDQFQLLLHEDLATQSSGSFAELVSVDERFRTVAIDPTSIVPDRMNPQDQIDFVVPKPGGSGTDEIGPFRILAIGSRTGMIDTGTRSGRVNEITIVWNTKDKDEKQRADQLFARLQTTGTKGLQIVGRSAAAGRGSPGG